MRAGTIPENATASSGWLAMLDAQTKWVLLGLFAWVIVPWQGPEYGLFESTQSEILDAYAWRSLSSSLISLGVLILFLLRPWRQSDKAQIIDAGLSIISFIGILFIAGYLNEALGYGAAIQLICFLFIFALALARMGFIQGDPFMTSAIVVIMASIAVFVLFPISTIFSKVLFLEDGTFTPTAFYDNITSFGVGRTLSNSLI